ncbi:hypothetical protein PsorP6_011727 [Peronosclerospora sorghi]|uniref:Uncharacterized protein n=1 Tax=Peronosclerospora sorghi TaxID=230839 RepID=A0ACC0WJ56_9STRA|nr:hypothetical protein PsorP6_011727 [Peronosclerospora sorghi]
MPEEEEADHMSSDDGWEPSGIECAESEADQDLSGLLRMVRGGLTLYKTLFPLNIAEKPLEQSKYVVEKIQDFQQYG